VRAATTYAVALLGLAACSGAGSSDVAPTLEQLRNANYENILAEQVTLYDGRYEGEPFMPGAASRDTITLLPETYTTGDLTGDDIDDAVVAIAWNAGGSGTYISLAVFGNQSGSPQNIAAIGLGDRVRIDSLGIENRTLVAYFLEHGSEDPMCCPTTIVQREWRLDDGDIVETLVNRREMDGRVTGYLVWGHEARSFKTCDGEREGWVINEAGNELVEVYDELAGAPYQEMYVEVRGAWEQSPAEGFGAEYPEALRITELIRAEREGFGCRRELDGFLYMASGNEPGWSVEIRADGLTMKTMTAPEGVDFPPAEILSEDSRIIVNAGEPGSGIQAVLERKRCVDSMSGARYSFAASVEMNGQQFKGCALQGQ
jgi:uncharacterized membrane protein